LVLDRILCIDEADGAGNAEPYLWTLFFKIDGDTFCLNALNLKGTITVDRRYGGHGNLPYDPEDGVDAGNDLPIPPSLGRWDTTLTPIPVVPPIKYRRGGVFKDIAGTIGVLCVLMEEDELSNSAAIAGYNALCSSFEAKMNEELNKLGLAEQELSEEAIARIESAVAAAAEGAMTAASTDLISYTIMGWAMGPSGIISVGAPDDFVGSANFRYTHDTLERDRQIFFERHWEREGEWKIFGHVSAERVPQFIGQFGPIIVFDQGEMAMRDFRHRAEVAEREGFSGAFPNFYTATYGRSNVGGTIFIKAPCAEWRDVRLIALDNPPLDDFAERFRATHRYATREGFAGGFPTFSHALYSTTIAPFAVFAPPKISFAGAGVINALNPAKLSPIFNPAEFSVRAGIVEVDPTVCGTVLIKSSCATLRDVPLTELGNPPLSDIGARFRATQDYATREGFVGGFPNFFHADHGNGIVCGTILLKPGAAEWRDVLLWLGPA
jgi:hypothetical protein